jgi:DNA-binding NarL/FixJ family response regulator
VSQPAPSLDRAKPQDIHILRAVLDHDGYKGAAQVLGIPEGTVRTRVHRALRRTGFSNLAAAARQLGRLEGREAS